MGIEIWKTGSLSAEKCVCLTHVCAQVWSLPLNHLRVKKFHVEEWKLWAGPFWETEFLINCFVIPFSHGTSSSFFTITKKFSESAIPSRDTEFKKHGRVSEEVTFLNLCPTQQAQSMEPSLLCMPPKIFYAYQETHIFPLKNYE